MQDNTPKAPQPYFRNRRYESLLNDGKNSKPRRKICGAFLYEDTTTLIFSRTNYGKSMLAFQFAYAAATGSDIDPCSALVNECEPMKTLVVDLELDARVHWERHGKVLEDKNPFLSNLVYLHEKLENKMMLGFQLLDKIEEVAVEEKALLVIIDNISKLLPDALKPDTATLIISMLNRIRTLTGASILVIGHTTKGNPKVCIQPTDYYGSAMLQNFFNELSYLDKTKDGNFFLCHSKTKHPENYMTEVPVFMRGEHHRLGVGFDFIALRSLDQVQLPSGVDPVSRQRTRNLSDFHREISCLIDNGFTQSRIAKLLDCSSASINHLLKSSKTLS